MRHPRRYVVGIARLEHARHAVAHEQDEVEQRGDDPDHRLDAGDPDELQRRLGEFAEQMQGAQRLAWADNAIKLAVDLTVAAMNRANIQGTTEQQAEQLRSVMAMVFPEAVTLVREAREGLQ